MVSADPSILLELAQAHCVVGQLTVAEELYQRLLHDGRTTHADELVAIKLRERARRGLATIGRQR